MNISIVKQKTALLILLGLTVFFLALATIASYTNSYLDASTGVTVACDTSGSGNNCGGG